ncbi:MAG: DUF2892 domain-containing protein [Leptolyngbya sp. SIOISBB]|nr:DUF2892 domain-containing protein [Leptolyngbya sp. SIOISBB]
MAGNIGGLDRGLRLLMAGILLYLGLRVYADSALGVGLDVVGAIAAFSGLVGFCGLYSLLGVNTRKADSNLNA